MIQERKNHFIIFRFGRNLGHPDHFFCLFIFWFCYMSILLQIAILLPIFFQNTWHFHLKKISFIFFVRQVKKNCPSKNTYQRNESIEQFQDLQDLVITKHLYMCVFSEPLTKFSHKSAIRSDSGIKFDLNEDFRRYGLVHDNLMFQSRSL